MTQDQILSHIKDRLDSFPKIHSCCIYFWFLSSSNRKFIRLSNINDSGLYIHISYHEGDVRAAVLGEDMKESQVNSSLLEYNLKKIDLAELGISIGDKIPYIVSNDKFIYKKEI